MTIKEIEDNGLLLYKAKVTTACYNIENLKNKYEIIAVYSNVTNSLDNVYIYPKLKKQYIVEGTAVYFELEYFCKLLYEGSPGIIESLFITELNQLFIHDAFRSILNCKQLFIDKQFITQTLDYINNKLETAKKVYENLQSENQLTLTDFTIMITKTYSAVSPDIMPLDDFLVKSDKVKDYVFFNKTKNPDIYCVYTIHNTNNEEFPITSNLLSDEFIIQPDKIVRGHYQGVAIINRTEWDKHKRENKQIILKADKLFVLGKDYDAIELINIYKLLSQLEDYIVYKKLKYPVSIKIALDILQISKGNEKFENLYKALKLTIESLKAKLESSSEEKKRLDIKSLNILVNVARKELKKLQINKELVT